MVRLQVQETGSGASWLDTSGIACEQSRLLWQVQGR